MLRTNASFNPKPVGLSKEAKSIHVGGCGVGPSVFAILPVGKNIVGFWAGGGGKGPRERGAVALGFEFLRLWRGLLRGFATVFSPFSLARRGFCVAGRGFSGSAQTLEQGRREVALGKAWDDHDDGFALHRILCAHFQRRSNGCTGRNPHRDALDPRDLTRNL